MQTSDSPDQDEEAVARIRERLVEWYERSHRKLPWRIDRDPYRILISEVMLVQTTVAAVIPYFARFLERFPDVKALAAADIEAVLSAWEGLGYYRRARQLHEAARQIVEQHGGQIPDSPEAVRKLPGVGRYIAGALLSQAFDRPEPILEANSQRVLCRLIACQGEMKSSQTLARLWEEAERLVPPRGAGVFNQALMELGALVCTPREPSCLICPLRADCRARQLGLQDELPRASPKPSLLLGSESCAVIRREAGGEEVLLVRREEKGLWGGFWEFPTIHKEGADPAGRSVVEPGGTEDPVAGITRLTGVRALLRPGSKPVVYHVTRYKMTLQPYFGVRVSGDLRAGIGVTDVRWIPVLELANFPMTSAGRRALRLATSEDDDPQRGNKRGRSAKNP